MTEEEKEVLEGERRTLCRIHSERLDRIEEKQGRIYVSMFGPNGNPKEGYVWDMEQVLLWINGDPDLEIKGLRQEWNGIKKTAMTGAWSAIILVGSGLLYAIGWILWKMVGHAFGIK